MAECCQVAGIVLKEDDVRLQELDRIIAKHKGKPGALIPVLHEAQILFGFLPELVQIRVAEGLDVPLSEVYGVITFYSLFTLKPRGKHVIGVCLGTACYVKGATAIVEAIQKTLNVKTDDTTDDGLFTLTITRCVGACGLAPVFNIGEDVYGRLTPDKVPEILAKYRQ